MSQFVEALHASGRSPEVPDEHDVYGWLVGDWELEVLVYLARDFRGSGLRGEVHCGWVLEGRAIQDTWIMPRREDRAAYTERAVNMYGTTLRIWDPAISAWRIRWHNPVRMHLEEQTGRRVGEEIVQVGARPDGTATRWRFVDIEPDAFHWIGESLDADGKTWTVEGEFLARRTGR